MEEYEKFVEMCGMMADKQPELVELLHKIAFKLYKESGKFKHDLEKSKAEKENLINQYESELEKLNSKIADLNLKLDFAIDRAGYMYRDNFNYDFARWEEEFNEDNYPNV